MSGGLHAPSYFISPSVLPDGMTLSIPTHLSCLHVSSIPQVSPILPGEREGLWSEGAASLPQALSGK